jgi:hypothetical protein
MDPDLIERGTANLLNLSTALESCPVLTAPITNNNLSPLLVRLLDTWSGCIEGASAI